MTTSVSLSSLAKEHLKVEVGSLPVYLAKSLGDQSEAAVSLSIGLETLDGLTTYLISAICTAMM